MLISFYRSHVGGLLGYKTEVATLDTVFCNIVLILGQHTNTSTSRSLKLTLHKHSVVRFQVRGAKYLYKNSCAHKSVKKALLILFCGKNWVLTT